MIGDEKEILKGLGLGAGIGIVGSLVSETSHWLGGPQLGYSKPSIRNMILVSISTGVSFILVGIGKDQYEKWDKKT